MMPDAAYWAGKRVLVTGHMGFKGAWLCYLLARLGARSVGYGLDPRPDPLLYRQLTLPAHESVTGDVNDLEKLKATIRDHGVEIVLHLAAQPIVLHSYRDPLETFRSNVMGSATLLEAVRECGGVASVVMITSDKVYLNREWPWPYRENDRLGGRDPYSASKAAAELVIASMVSSFFGGAEAHCRIATARAGNIIGGGDWGAYRLLPDAARAFAQRETLVVRNPSATRPWQHVLDPLVGYLLLAQSLAEGAGAEEPGAWNFGPAIEDAIPVRKVADLFTAAWGGGVRWQPLASADAGLHEAGSLSLDSSRARSILGWSPVWRVEDAIIRTARWYREYTAGALPAELVERDVDDYLRAAASAA